MWFVCEPRQSCVRGSVLLCVTKCYSVAFSVCNVVNLVASSETWRRDDRCSALFCCIVLQYVVVWLRVQDETINSLLRCVAVCCSVLQCVAVCCSVLQCVAVCCSVTSFIPRCDHFWQLVCCIPCILLPSVAESVAFFCSVASLTRRSNRPPLWIMYQYFRADPPKLPLRNWYNCGTKHFTRPWWSGGNENPN